MNIECLHIKDQNQYTKSLQGKKIYKDQCVRCFHEPTSKDGLFVCMKCFNGFCPIDRDIHTKDHCHNIFVNITMTLKNVQQKFEITKLAIGKQGGAVGGDEYETSHKVYCNICKISNIQGENILEPQVQSLINTDSPFKKQSLVSWQLEIFPCQHTLTLEQNLVNKNLMKCSDCELSTNLWLCLTCGNTGCGRKNWDGTGGNSHGIQHFQKTKHPLVVKLGTITAEGQASLYCYSCNNDVKDDNLKAHLQILGISIVQQKKTQKTVTEMNLDLNLNYSLSKLLERNENKSKIMYGKDYTGMQNIGNSCYLNSVVQTLNSLDQFRDQYYNKGEIHTKQCKRIPSQCFYCQISKISKGLNSGIYSQKKTRTRLINEETVNQEFQQAIKPFDFKLLIAQNNAQFCSNRQQDALEYMQWFFDRLVKQQPNFGMTIPNLFDYKLCNRLICQSCGNYKEIISKTNQWKFPVLPPSQKDINQFYASLEKQCQQIKASKSCEDPEYYVQFNDCLNILRAGDSLSVNCPTCNKNTEFISYNCFKTTPKYLLAVANRFVLQKWVPKKLNALIKMPQEFNVKQFLIDNLKTNGKLMKDEVKSQAKYSQQNLGFLQSMGYGRNASIRALIQTKDNMQAAINWIMDNINNDIDRPIQQSKKPGVSVNHQAVLQIQQMGFEQIQAKIALIKNKGDVPTAIQWLFNINGQISPYLDLLEEPKQKMEVQQVFDQNTNYQLKAVIVHLGKSVHHGHYVAYIKKNKQWTLFNDQKVTVPQTPILGKGFIYLYQKK